MRIEHPPGERSPRSQTTAQRKWSAKVFPGYVLVKMVMTDETWHLVRNVRGVTGFVGSGSKPIPLTDEEVASPWAWRSTRSWSVTR